MVKTYIEDVIVENWQENMSELAKLNGLQESSILLIPSKIGKTRMLQVAQELSIARKKDCELKQGLKIYKEVYDSMKEDAGE